MNTLNKLNHETQSDSPRIINPLDPEEFKRQGYMMIDFLADYYAKVGNYPVLSQVEPGYLKKRLPTSAPLGPEPIESILEDVQEHIIPGITHWMSPNYYGYFPSSSSIAGFMGEMLSTGFGVVGFNWISSPAATELESIVMDWLGQVLMLPKTFLFSGNGNGGGVMLGTTCEAILCTLVAARDRTLSQVGAHNIGKLVVYGSDQTHSALKKAAQIAGIHPKNFRAIKTKRSSSFSLSPYSLLSTILLDIENGLIPCFLCATVGTTTTAAIDPVGPLCNVAKDYGIWVHVDAAYAGAACICPEFRYCIDGVELANSFSFNTHKWFLTNLTCCCLWVKDHTALTKSLSTNPHYLRNTASESKQVIDYKDWQVTLSRKFTSLRLWLVLRSYGVDNLRNFLRSHVKMAKTFEELVRLDKRFEIVVPRVFSLVCLRISPSAIANGLSNGTIANGNGNGTIANANGTIANGNGTIANGNGNGTIANGNGTIANGNGNGTIANGNGNGTIANGNGNGTIANGMSNGTKAEPIENGMNDEHYMVNQVNRKLLDAINSSGKIYMTHGEVEGIYVIRCAIGSTLTEEHHVITAWKLVQEHANSLLGAF